MVEYGKLMEYGWWKNSKDFIGFRKRLVTGKKVDLELSLRELKILVFETNWIYFKFFLFLEHLYNASTTAAKFFNLQKYTDGCENEVLRTKETVSTT